MISISADPTTAPPPQPLRSLFNCDRHPSEQFTGFCPGCLCERLTSLDNSSSNTPSSSRRPSSASAAIRSLFSSNLKASHLPQPPLPPKPRKPPPFDSQLRRANSFSASKNESLALGLAFEPQRKSCDVRVRNTLWSLFTIDDENKTDLNLNAQNCPKNAVDLDEGDDNGGGGHEIRPVANSYLENPSCSVGFEVEQVTTLPLKEQMDLLTIPEKKNSGGGIWAAASVFRQKWQKWRQKQKHKTKKDTTLPHEKPISHQPKETQSEVADYGHGRRSCDTNPRFSIDAGRISVDDPRYSFDEPPRASWDGYLIGKSFNRLAPMFAVMEDVPQPDIPRPDMLMPVVESESMIVPEDEGESVPGGSVQTREYYTDSSFRRRKSLDRSSSLRKVARDACSETLELARDSSSSISRSGEEKDPKRGWRWRLWGLLHGRGGAEHKDENYCGRGNTLERSYSASWHDPRSRIHDPATREINRSSSVRWRKSDHIGATKNGSCRKPVAMNRHCDKRRETEFLRLYLAPPTPHTAMPTKSGSKGIERRNVKVNNGGTNNTNSQSIATSVMRLY